VRFLKSKLVIAGLILFAAGSGPLLVTILLAAFGMTKDPNPNPVGFGLLAAFTFWPSLLLLGMGIWRTLGSTPVVSEAPAGEARRAAHAQRAAPGMVLRIASAITGVGLMIVGVNIVEHQPPSRGRSLVLVMGLVAVVWAAFGRVPGRRK
jgi:hypothetical protein